MTTSGEWPLNRGHFIFCRLNRLITHRQSRRAPFGRASPARCRFAPAAARFHRARVGRDFPAAVPAAAAFVQGGWQRLSSDDPVGERRAVMCFTLLGYILLYFYR